MGVQGTGARRVAQERRGTHPVVRGAIWGGRKHERLLPVVADGRAERTGLVAPRKGARRLGRWATTGPHRSKGFQLPIRFPAPEAAVSGRKRAGVPKTGSVWSWPCVGDDPTRPELASTYKGTGPSCPVQWFHSTQPAVLEFAVWGPGPSCAMCARWHLHGVLPFQVVQLCE